MNENVKWPVKCSQQTRENEAKSLVLNGGEYRNRTGVHGFAIRCVTTPPTRLKALWCGADSVVRGAVQVHCYGWCSGVLLGTRSQEVLRVL